MGARQGVPRRASDPSTLTIFAQDNVSSQARLYGAAMSMGFSVADVQNWPAVVEAVTAEDIMRVGREHIDINRSVTGYLRRQVEG